MKQEWFYQRLTLDFTSFDTIYEEIENTQKSTSAYWHDHLSEKHSFDWSSWAELAGIFVEHRFHWKDCLTDKLWLFTHELLGDISQEWWEPGHFMENKWQYLLTMIKQKLKF